MILLYYTNLMNFCVFIRAKVSLEKIVSRNNTVCQSKVLILFRTYLLQLADVMDKLS
ncbi:hypothetical protein ENHY17A_90001 [Moraxellaceae bacterium 17A]|nr:hypothetical protein ENHY17A_90001 [Moraxellaceae bacterium 17A]